MRSRNVLCLVLSFVVMVAGCRPDVDTTDYSKPYNATERRNEATADRMREAIRQVRADERAYQRSH